MRVRRGVYTTQLAPIIKIRGDAFRDTFLGTRRGDGLPFSAAFPAPSVRPSARDVPQDEHLRVCFNLLYSIYPRSA